MPRKPTTTKSRTSSRKMTLRKTSSSLSLAREKSSGLNVRPGKRAQALDRLGVTAEQMQGVPQISHLLKEAEDGLPQVLQALRFSVSDEAQAFVKKYDSLSETDRKSLRWEEIATAAGVDTLQLLGVATIALAQQGQTVAEIIAATGHPLMVKKTIQMGLSDAGVKDREMLHINRGWLPSNKGNSVVNRIQIANLSNPDSPANKVEVSGELPLMDDFIKDVHPIRTHNLLGDGQ